MKTDVMVVSTNVKWLETYTRHVSEQDRWRLIPATDGEQAIEKFQQTAVEIVLLAGDLEDESKRKLRKIFSFQQEDLILEEVNDLSNISEKINHLVDQLESAQRVYSFTDNAFQHAVINIRTS